MFRILILSIFYVCSLPAAVGDNSVTEDSGFTYSLKEHGNGTVRYLTPEYSLQSVIDADGNTYKRPSLLNASQISDPGQPDLPSSSTFIAIDPAKTYSVNVNIISSRFTDDIEILPKNSWENDAEISFSKGEVYNSEGFYPENIASISEPMVMRELTIVNLTVSPFRYYPQQKRLEEFTEIEIELVETGESDNTTFRPATRSRAFEPLYESLITNYASLDRDNIPFQRPSILYVLPSNIGNLLGTVTVLMDWKRRVGYEVNYISSSNIVNNSNDLKNYIETAYQAWENPPEYVTIIADAEGSYDVPTHFENWSGYNGEGDHPYSMLVGNDLLPEVFLGRLSFDSQSHLQTIISKTLNYESSPYMGENWFQRACLVGDPSTSGISCVITNNNIKEVMQLYGYNYIWTVYGG